MSKKRVDLSGTCKPLTDNPFGSLGGLTDKLPPQPEPESVPPRTPGSSEPPFQVEKTRKGGLPVFIEKRAKGKTVTVVRNVSGDAEALLKLLKKRCGAGGVLREGDVEIQGDHRTAVESFLRTL